MSTMTYNNIIDMNRYRQEQEMTTRRYVLTPVCDFTPTTEDAPRPRRDHRNYGHVRFVNTCLNLTIIAITMALTIQLLAVV